MLKIDSGRLVTIIKYSILQDIRNNRVQTGKKKSYKTIIYLTIMNFLSGVMIGFICDKIIDHYTIAFIATTFFMILTGNFIIQEYSTLITGSEDYSFYSTKPVNASTYFFAKIIVILIFVLFFSIVYFLPIGFIFIIKYRNPVLIVSILYSIFSSGIIISLIIINLYAFLLKFVPLKSLKSFSTFLNFILFFLIYGTYFFLFTFIRQASISLIIEFKPFFILLPNSWAPSILLLSKGVLSVFTFFLSLFSIPILLILACKVISMEFAEKMSEQEIFSVKKKSRTKTFDSSLLWKTHEEKAIALLLKNKLKHDVQFKLSIFVIIPISLLYFAIVIFLNKAQLQNPFTPQGIAGFKNTILLYVAIGFFPVYIKNALAYSNEAEASWLFFITPYNKVKLILSVKKFIFIFFILPYLLIFIIIYIVVTGVIIPILMHFIVVFLLAFIQTDIFLFFFSEIPFTKKYQRGHRSTQFLIKMAISIILPFPMLLFVVFLYPEPAAYWFLVAGLIITALILEKTGRKVASKKLNRSEFNF